MHSSLRKAFTALALLIAASITHAGDGKVIHVAADIWCPYNCQPGGAQPGYLVELLKLAFEPAGYAIDYKILPWKRALSETRSGKIDAAIGAVEGNSLGNLLGKEVLGHDKTVLVTRSGDSLDYVSPGSLDRLALGVIENYTYDNNGPLDAYLAQRAKQDDRISVIHQSRPLDVLFRMLQRGRIDAFPENLYVAQYMAAAMGLEKSVKFVSTGVGDRIYIAFSPNSRGAGLLAQFDQRIAQMRADGTLNRVLEKYGISPMDNP